MLTLPIKKCWFDMIARGEKLEEYRRDTAYYAVRFDNQMEMDVCFRNGYRSDSPRLYCRVQPRCTSGAKVEWGGDPDKVCWILKILKCAASEEELIQWKELNNHV